MTTLQKIIKYLAIGLAFAIIIGMVSGLVKLGMLLSKEPNDSDPVLKDPQSWTLVEPVTHLEINLVGLEVQVQEGSAFTVETDSGYLRCTQKGGKVTIQEKKHSLVNAGNTGTLKITLPADLVLEKVAIDAGAGDFDIGLLRAQKLDLDLGAGKVRLSGLQITADTDIDGGAGQIIIQNSTLTNLDLDLGVGDLELSGRVPGNSEIDCGVGKVALSLTSGDQYRLRLDKGIGSATLNGQEMVGSTYYGTGPNNLEISGGIGSIQIELAHNEG